MSHKSTKEQLVRFLGDRIVFLSVIFVLQPLVSLSLALPAHFLLSSA